MPLAPEAVLARIDVIEGEGDVLADLTRRKGPHRTPPNGRLRDEAALVEENHEQNQTDEAVFAPHLVPAAVRQAVLARIAVFEGDDEVLAEHTRHHNHAGHHQTTGSETKPRWLSRT